MKQIIKVFIFNINNVKILWRRYAREEQMAKVYCIFNQKGGVGKTATATNLGAALAKLGQRVLIVDADSQGNLTSGLDMKADKNGKTLYDVMCGNLEIQKAIMTTKYKNLMLLPANSRLAGCEVELVNVSKRELVLKKALLGILSAFDYILIDCPPSLGLMSINALAASDGIIVPIQCEYYALEGVSNLINTVNLVKRGLNASLDIVGIVLTMFDSRTNLSIQVASEVKRFFREKVFDTIIPRNVKIAESPSFGKPVIYYDETSSGAKAYMALALEITQKGQEDEK